MTRNQVTRIGALVLAITAMVAVSTRIAAAKSKAKSQGLWVGGEKYFSEFQGKSLLTSGTPKAHLVFGSVDYQSPSSIVFDAHQNLWTVFLDPNGPPSAAIEISRGDIASIKAGKPVKPKVIISPGTNSSVPFEFAESIGLDAAGDLWVIDLGRRLLELLSSQIKKSGGPAPHVVITPTAANINNIKFDGSDNLWIAASPTPYNPSNPEQMWRFTASDRAASGSANPSLVLNVPGEINVLDFAFDSPGNLWIAGWTSQSEEIEMIPAGDLSGTGVITPSASTIIISPAFTPEVSDTPCLGGIDFDASGDLWASVNDNSFGCVNGIVEFTASQLTTGGNLTPSVVNRPEWHAYEPVHFRSDQVRANSEIRCAAEV
jgi:hypothetical protein